MDAHPHPPLPRLDDGPHPRPGRVRPATTARRGRPGRRAHGRADRRDQDRDPAGLQGRAHRRDHRRRLRRAGRHPAAGAGPRRAEEGRLLPAAAGTGHLPARRAGHHPRLRARRWAAEHRGTGGPLPAALHAGARPDRGLPARAATRAGLRQPRRDLPHPGRTVLGQDRNPGAGHRHHPPPTADRPTVEARPGDQEAHHHHAGRATRRAHQSPAERHRRTAAGARLLPRHRPMGGGGAGPLGTLGGALPDQRRRDRPHQDAPAPQVPHGSAHPRAAPGPARAGAHRERAATRGRTPPARRRGHPARRAHPRHRRDPAPRDHGHQQDQWPESSGRRTPSPAGGAT